MRAIQRTAALHEQIEDARQQLGGDADAVVTHGDDDLGRFGVCGAPGAERDVGALAAVFAGVAEEIAQDLLQPRGVGIQKHRFRRQRHRELLTALRDLGACQAHCRRENRLQCHRLPPQLDLPLGDA
ncbi:MAG TPA: hypothetical protein DDZ88_27440 [Verrucomicrobiales bacterium]|nr:hypothetical protein [Verrucomicrobiales bacterium]